ncbi:flagellar hook protein FlgE [Paraferrimonas sp. SM1919]|uniref:flagellar hook protein FlgE n=1 Tax=Paraferrimonas sp. SM1919 TaxID=2662263 RepID=UPI0013D89B6E|nr:flagellar hook protein FlgE [Paraferrimonas sp. SM1919]
MSYNIALSGLRATSQDLGTISHNIANVSTAGFKAGRGEFASIYSGGQAGGVEYANVSQNFDRDGDMINTGRALDLGISGNGFFMTKSAGQTTYTRSGFFQQDRNNFIVDNNGKKLQGYQVDANGQLNTGAVTDLKISAASLPAKASENLELGMNLDARLVQVDRATVAFDPADPSSFNASSSAKIYDSLGNEHVMTQYFTKTAPNTWEVQTHVNGATVGAPHTLSFDTSGNLSAGQIYNFTGIDPQTGADLMNLNIDFTSSTQYAAEFNVNKSIEDGYTSGELAGVRVEDDGSIFAVYTNGQDRMQGQVALANFPNTQGLRQVGQTSWEASFASGSPLVGTPDSGTLGSLVGGAYEGSNVDLTGELVSLMSAQRNYQANAKTISTADQLTKALFNAI